MHFTYLEFFDVENYLDLYYEVAETYAEKDLYEDALGIYETIISNEKVTTIIIIIAIIATIILIVN